MYMKLIYRILVTICLSFNFGYGCEEQEDSCEECCSTKNPVIKIDLEVNEVQKDSCGDCCSIKKTNAETFETPQIFTSDIYTTGNQRLIFKIEGMCCPTEAEILKSTLRPIINQEDEEAKLILDLINAKLIIETTNCDVFNKEEIIKAVQKTGMQAILWGDHVKKTQKQKTFWEKYGRYSLNALSAACLVSGAVVHAMSDGVGNALGGGIDENQTTRPENPPLASMALYSTAIIAGSYYIVPKAINAIKNLRLDTNTLMLSATAGAIGINHWFEAATSMYLFSAAEILEQWNVGRSNNAIRSLMELAPSTAQVVDNNGNITEQLVENIPIDTIITVRPGERIPMDSVVISGTTSVNQAPITGESLPTQKEIGDQLFAGTINEDSVVQCKVTKLDSDSTLASIVRKIEEIQLHRSKSEQFIERFAQYYVPTMISASLLTSIVPPLLVGSPWYPWIYKGLELLVISCPCSLIISTPVSIVAGITAAAQSGILIKGGAYLENVAHIKAFAMDKTGTLTTGAPVVQNIIPLNGYNMEELLKVANALEFHSDHPLARAIQRKATEQGITNQPAKDFQIFKGKGGEGYVDEELFWIGSHRFLHERMGDNETADLHEQIQKLEDKGHSIVAIGTGQNTCGLISISDAARPESKDAIQAIKRANVQSVVMLTGDNKGAAETIANSVGIDEYYAELLPEDKVHQIEALKKKYKQVAMVGDGINDAPAMAMSNLGIAMGSVGSDAAIEAADIALMSDDLGKLPWLINHSHRTLNIIKQNITFSLAVKSAFVGLTFAGKSTLWMAMLSDMGSSFIVVSNGLRLLNNTAKPTTQRQSILAVQNTTIPTLENYSSDYGTIAMTKGDKQQLTSSACETECKDCGGKGKEKITTDIEDKDDLV